ncbi:MAG: sugar phosphate isomerase/epimerase [Roseburia sp.]|nr:sugar phosphate isomerase/epimerase [Roseburia sp.]
MSKLLCSTGALIGRPNNRNYRLLESLSKELDCDGFEFMMYSSWYDEADEITEYLNRISLPTPVMHCEKHIGEKIGRGEEGDLEEAIRLFTINCKVADKIHAEKIVIHLWDGLISDQNFQNNLEAYGELQEISKEYGVELLVENVVCNQEDPMKHWCELAERYPDISFVFDTKMAAFHEQLELLYQEEYRWLWDEGHIRHYHVNDYAGGYMDWSNLRTLPIGKGHIDFERFFAFIRKIKYDDTFTVEATAFGKDGKIDVEMLNGCFKKIQQGLGVR